VERKVPRRVISLDQQVQRHGWAGIGVIADLDDGRAGTRDGDGGGEGRGGAGGFKHHVEGAFVTA